MGGPPLGFCIDHRGDDLIDPLGKLWEDGAMLLVNKGADVNTEVPITIDVDEFPNYDTTRRSFFWLCCRYGWSRVVRLMLRVSTPNLESLNNEIVRANPCDYIEVMHPWCQAPLGVAYGYGHVDTVEMLLESFADPRPVMMDIVYRERSGSPMKEHPYYDTTRVRFTTLKNQRKVKPLLEDYNRAWTEESSWTRARHIRFYPTKFHAATKCFLKVLKYEVFINDLKGNVIPDEVVDLILSKSSVVPNWVAPTGSPLGLSYIAEDWL